MADDEFDDEFDDEEYDDIEPGAGEASVDEATGDVSTQLERLATWEEQLLSYNDKLAEEGWRSWKKGAVRSVMHELQRKVVPDVWRDEVRAANDRVGSMQVMLSEGTEREKALCAKIEQLENGPGCARELREQLEAAQMQISQEEARQRQRRVMAEMLTAGSDVGGSGGVSGAIAAMMATRKLSQGGDRVRGLSVDATTGGSAGAAGASPELQQRAATAARQLAEAQEELKEVRTEREETVTQLQASLEAERKERARATEALAQVHVEAGVHEAQEMVQLKLELAALTEEVDFLRARETAINEEQNRLQMVAEMSKRLGTNVSKFELESLRSQVASLQDEASRLHESNQQLQAQLKVQTEAAAGSAALRSEVGAFQKTNDELETAKAAAERRLERMRGALASMTHRTTLLERQLVLAHTLHTGGKRGAGAAGGQRGGGGGGGAAGGGGGGADALEGAPADAQQMQQQQQQQLEQQLEQQQAQGGTGSGTDRLQTSMPLLWAGDEVGGYDDLTGGPNRLRRGAPATPAIALTGQGGGPSGAAGGGAGGRPGVPQKAVLLADEVEGASHLAVRFAAAAPKQARRAAAEGVRVLSLLDNTPELAAAAALRRAGALHEKDLAAALTKKRSADAQELRVVKAGATARTLNLRMAKLDGLRHWWLLGLMRAYRRWCLLLEVGAAYDAAIGQAARLLDARTAGLVSELDAAHDCTVQALLWQPAMLGPLGEMRRRLQAVASEAEALKGQLVEVGAAAEGVLPNADYASLISQVGGPGVGPGAGVLQRAAAPRLGPVGAAGGGAPWLAATRGSEQLQKLAQIAASATSPERRGGGVGGGGGHRGGDTGRTCAATFEATGLGGGGGGGGGGGAVAPAAEAPSSPLAGRGMRHAVAARDPSSLSRLLPPGSPSALLPPSVGAMSTAVTPFATRATEEAARRAGIVARHEAASELAALRLKLRVVVQNWRTMRRALVAAQAQAQALEAEVDGVACRAADRGAAEAARAYEAEGRVRQLLLQIEELSVREAGWRRQAAQQAEAATQQTKQARRQHEEELGVLSEKLRQLLHERTELQATCTQRQTDVDVLTHEVLRMRAADRAAGAVHSAAARY